RRGTRDHAAGVGERPGRRGAADRRARPMSDLDALVYDWNRDGRVARPDYRSVELDDETLRDGLQGPSVRNPPLEVKIRLLRLMDQLGIDSADIGLPGASSQARATVVALAKETAKLRITPNVAVRTHPADIKGAIEAAVESGVAIETCAFIGSSPIRRFAESWSIETMTRQVEESVRLAVNNDLPVMFVTEDTTRADPETLITLYETAIGAGASRICASDTVGHASLGADAFRTGTGVHASAVVKALRRGDRSLADRVYSGVPASVVGREQRIEVGPMSGESNIVFWLERRGIATDRARIDRIMTAAKASDRLLTDEELHALARLD